ncbi:hypothetical protein P872_06875 [Rhodonellum psychrophilum GCM71 = DSM 17998]|uniref:Uncharacterized protein n=2 Tax=Rhodonellum TaxID=336827 RepID=U5BWN1_9BACT|nr:hypothetical protein P872_06875 [Rhodonellum psychrophilum GCM71 = DSM 17998]SDY69788.1 hypothetical protein SAMN05444412_102280 [Rhodonellum ikkaensis]
MHYQFYSDLELIHNQLVFSVFDFIMLDDILII